MGIGVHTRRTHRGLTSQTFFPGPFWGLLQYGGLCQVLHTEHGISLLIGMTPSTCATFCTCYSTAECLQTSRIALTNDVDIKTLENHVRNSRTKTIIVNLAYGNVVKLILDLGNV